MCCPSAYLCVFFFFCSICLNILFTLVKNHAPSVKQQMLSKASVLIKIKLNVCMYVCIVECFSNV